jgi:hypothetical protein
MSASKTSPKRRPYNKPALKKLTPEEAEAELKAKAIPGDEQAQQLMDAIRVRLEEKNASHAK